DGAVAEGGSLVCVGVGQDPAARVDGGVARAGQGGGDGPQVAAVVADADEGQVVGQAAEVGRELAAVGEPVGVMAAVEPAFGGDGVVDVGAVGPAGQDVEADGGVVADVVPFPGQVAAQAADGEDQPAAVRAPLAV